MEKFPAHFFSKSHDYVVNSKSTKKLIIASKKIIKNLEVGIPPCDLGSPEDVAFAAFFLASDPIGYMAGMVLNVDGGILPGQKPDRNKHFRTVKGKFFRFSSFGHLTRSD